MKARVKATGKIVEVEKDNTDYPIMRKFGMTLNVYKDSQNLYNPEELEFLDDIKDNQNITEKSLPKDEPDYWEKLKHQAAIAAMQTLIPRYENMRQDWINGEFEEGYKVTGEEADTALKDYAEALADVSKVYATALVNKLKEEQK